MNKRQINQKEMMVSVLCFMDDNATKWSAIPMVVTCKTEFTDLLTQIDSAEAAQSEAKVFIGESRTTLKKNIAQKADMLNDLVECYASLNDMPELESRMSDSYTNLFTLKNEDFKVKVAEIITETGNYKDDLIKDYGLTEAQITDIKADLDRFCDKSNLPRSYRVATTLATKELDSLITEAMDLLNNKMDKVMKIFKRSDTNFYNGYTASRIIVD